MAIAITKEPPLEAQIHIPWAVYETWSPKEIKVLAELRDELVAVDRQDFPGRDIIGTVYITRGLTELTTYRPMTGDIRLAHDNSLSTWDGSQWRPGADLA
jgi:hypothetical protein